MLHRVTRFSALLLTLLSVRTAGLSAMVYSLLLPATSDFGANVVTVILSTLAPCKLGESAWREVRTGRVASRTFQ